MGHVRSNSEGIAGRFAAVLLTRRNRTVSDRNLMAWLPFDGLASSVEFFSAELAFAFPH